MDWILFSLSSVLCFSLSNTLRRVLMKDDKTDAMASSIVFQMLGSILIGIFAFYKGFVFTIPSQFYPNYLFVGLLWGLATFLQFKAFHYLEASEATIIGTLESVVIIIAAHFFLNDFFTVPMVVGTLLVLTGVVFISQVKKKVNFNRGILYMLGFCFFAGLGAVNDTYMVKNVDAMSYLAIGFLLPAFFLMLVSPQSVPKIKSLLVWTQLKKMFLLTFFYSLGAILFVYAILNGAQVSQLGPISNSTVIVTVLLATLFLGEREHLVRKVICTLLVFAGVLLLR